MPAKKASPSKKAVTATVEKTVPAEKISVPPVVTKKIYTIKIMVKEPLRHVADDIFVDKPIGAVTYNEFTGDVEANCGNPRYDTLFKEVTQKSYKIETDDAPATVVRSLDEPRWAMNLANAIDLRTTSPLICYALEPEIVSEEIV